MQEKIKAIAELQRIPEEVVLNIAVNTYLAKGIKFRLKDRETQGEVTARGVNSLIVGRDGKRPIPKRLERLFAVFNPEIISKDVSEYGRILTENMLNSIIYRGEASISTVEKYTNELLENDDLILMTLEIAAKQIGMKLVAENHQISNMYMDRMCTMIQTDKRKLNYLFSQLDKTEAILEYRNTLDKYFREFLDRSMTATGQEIVQIGIEENILHMVSEEFVEDYLSGMCFLIKSRIVEKLKFEHPQLTLKF